MNNMVEQMARSMFANFSWYQGQDPDKIVYLTTRFTFRTDTGNASTAEVIHGPAWKMFESTAAGVIDALTEAGFVILPRAPTEVMIDFGETARDNMANESITNAALASIDVRRIWGGMINASD